MEGTLKVQVKSLTIVLHEAHLIVNLYSFPLPRVLQASTSFLKVINLPTFQAEQLSILSPLLNRLFWGISQLPGYN